MAKKQAKKMEYMEKSEEMKKLLMRGVEIKDQIAELGEIKKMNNEEIVCLMAEEGVDTVKDKTGHSINVSERAGRVSYDVGGILTDVVDAGVPVGRAKEIIAGRTKTGEPYTVVTIRSPKQ